MKPSGKNTLKIKIEDLEVGMYVADVGAGWLRHPWKTKSKLITSQGEIRELVEAQIQEVTIDLNRGRPPGYLEQKTPPHKNHPVTPRARETVMEPVKSEKRTGPGPDRPRSPSDTTPMVEELPRARKTYSRALNVTREFINDIRAGKSIKVEKVQESVETMIDSVFRNQDAMISLLKLRTYDEYTFTHSLNVAVLCIATGRQVNFNRNQLALLGLGSIFHDVGKLFIPDEILNKPGRLSEEEFKIMQSHPELGARFMEEKYKGLSPTSVSVVRHHHERMDGDGYPDKLSAKDIDPFMAVCGIADVYDALSSARVYKPAMPPYEALKIIYKSRNSHFHPVWIDRFIQCLGIYPPGTLVQLTSGEVGVVFVTNHSFLARPKLRLIKNPKLLPLGPDNLLDLNQPEFEKLEIKQVVSASMLGIDPATYFEV